jgi:hypothetical protein
VSAPPAKRPTATFSHFGAKPLGPIRAAEQQVDGMLKPNGLWISVDGPHDWRDWCEENNQFIDRLAYQHHVEIDLTRVLWLKDVRALRRFTQEFVSENHWLPFGMLIDWPRVAERYAGIVIAPYFWDCRFELLWYAAWDCASGCVWDPSIVIDVRQCKPEVR